MPGTTFLPAGGPMGTFIGILIGALIMIIIGMNYHYFIHRYSDIATLILQNDRFVVTPAYNGHEAVEIKNSKPGDYDVIFIDIMMPIMNGYEATNTIRSLENKDLANIPIIAMTANAYANDIKSALDAGMNGHISKPLEIDKMRTTIKEVLKK